MTISNQESTLAATLGVSGTMSGRAGIKPIAPLTMIWRRMLQPADALLSSVTTQADIALAERTVSVNEGQWVTLDSSGNAINAASDTGPGATGLAWPCFGGGDRFDGKGGITVLHGAWVADTSYFDQGGTYAPGTMLQVCAAAGVTVQGVATQKGALTSITVTTVAHLMTVVAICERAPFGITAELPAGSIRVRSVR